MAKAGNTDASKTDLAKFEGKWRQISMEEDGVLNPPDTHGAPGATTTISGSNFLVTTADGHVVLKGSFELDDTIEPKSIVWIDSIGPDAGKRLPASYILNGDNFVFIAANEGETQPTAFQTRTGLTMRSFVRGE